MIDAVPGLAQTGGGQSVMPAILWAGAVCFVAILAVYGVVRFRKAMMADEPDTVDDPLSLSTIRDMHRRGELSDEEFEKARNAVLKMAPGSNPLRDEFERRRSQPEASELASPPVTAPEPTPKPGPDTTETRPEPDPQRERFESKYPTEPPPSSEDL